MPTPPPPPPPPPPAEDESPGGDPCLALAECQRLLEAVPAAAASSPAFRRHWPSISASLAALSSSLATPTFPPAAPLLTPLAAALRALLSVSASAAGADAPRLGHLHTVSLLSSTAAELTQLAADANLLASSSSPAPSPSSDSSSAGAAASAEDALVSRLRMGSAASRATALEELTTAAPTLPPVSASAAVSAVAALLDSAAIISGDLRERAVAALAALATSSSDATTRAALAQEAGVVVPHLCRALESGCTEHACAALLPLTATSRDACAAVAARGGVSALLSACAGGTPAAQAAAAGVLRNLAAFTDLLPAFRADDEGSGGGGGAVPVLLQLVSLGTPKAQEQALGCLQRLTAGDGDDNAQRLKVEAFQAGALPCVRDFLDGAVGVDGVNNPEPPGLAPALGLLRNMASFRYIAEIAVAAEGGTFVAHVVAALGSSDRSVTRTEAALALAELCGNAGDGKASRRHQQQYYEDVVADGAVPRLVWMMEAKSAPERDAAARALAAVLAASSACRKAFRKDERGVVNAVQLLALDHHPLPVVSGARSGGGAVGVGVGVGVEVVKERRFPVAVLLAVAQSRRCRKQMVAAGACGFLQALVAAEVEGAKRLAECLGKGKMLGVFPRT